MIAGDHSWRTCQFVAIQSEDLESLILLKAGNSACSRHVSTMIAGDRSKLTAKLIIIQPQLLESGILAEIRDWACNRHIHYDRW